VHGPRWFAIAAAAYPAAATYCCRLSLVVLLCSLSIMQTQRLHQPSVCSQRRPRVVRAKGVKVCADASARVRGDARRVHRWLSDVRHWKSFYPGVWSLLFSLSDHGIRRSGPPEAQPI
jgi:hypothetical protein